MADTAQEPPRLSRRMRAALAAEGPPFGHPRPNRRELAAIKALIAAKGKDHDDISLGRAMRVAAEAAPDDDTAKSVASVLNDRKLDPATRRQAAAILGDLPTPASRRGLLRALRQADRATEVPILRSLAKIGNARTAAALAELPESDSSRLRRLRDFARATIEYREGRDVAPEAEEAVMPTASVAPVTRAAPEAVDDAVVSLRGSRYGVTLQRELGYRFTCAGREHVVLLNAELQRGQLVEDASARRRIAGIVAAREDGADHFVTRHLIFTRPTGRDIEVTVVQPTTGEVALRGSLRDIGPGLALSLSDHRAERVPTQVEGLVTEHDIALTARFYPEDAQEGDPGESEVIG